MRFFYDTEFIEVGPAHPIIPLSIGMVAENGETFYAVFERTREEMSLANEFVWKHVMSEIRYERISDGGQTLRAEVVSFSAERIRQELLDFVEEYSGGNKPEFWSYYSDYDHVVLCQLFGRMIDLPEGWPKFTLDIKQWAVQLGNPELPAQDPEDEHHALYDAQWIRKAWEFLKDYEHKMEARRQRLESQVRES